MRLQLHKILNFGIRRGKVVSLTLRPLYSLENFTVISRIGGLVGPEAAWVFGKGKRFLSQPEIEPRFLACPTRGLIAMHIALSLLSRPVW